MRIPIFGYVSKRLLISVLLLFLAEMVFAIDLNPTLPHFTGSNPYIDAALLNDEVNKYFMEYKDLIETKLAFIPDDFHNLARAFANTSVFSSDGASQRGYEGFKLFTLTTGFMSALQVPREFTLIDEIKDAINSGDGEAGFELIKDNMDIGLGFDAQIFNAQLGINTSKFLLKGLYLGFKFSMFDSNWMKAATLPDFYFKTMSAGVTASYQLISQKRLPLGLLVWRGLNLGAGFVWQNTSFGLSKSIIPDELLDFSIVLDTLGTVSMRFDDIFHLGINTNTFIIPVEAMTSMRLLWFLNVALGAGVDIAFGGSSIKAHGSMNVIEKPNLPEGIEMDITPSLSYSLGGISAPGIFNLKVMGAVGFNFGPVLIDIPVTYYIKDNGYSFGLTLGFTL
jgi:hypothetical protein